MVFVSDVIDLKNGQMENIWLMAHFQNRLNKRQIKKTNVTNACEDLRQQNRNIQLRTHGQMLLGLCRIHQKQVEYLHSDCNDAVSKLKITFNKKSNVDLPPDKDHKRAGAITLQSNNTDDPNLLSMDADNEGIFDDIPNHDPTSDTMSDFGRNGLNPNFLTLGTSSHGIGMIQTSTGQTNNLNNNTNDTNNNNLLNNDDAVSISSFGVGNISNIGPRGSVDGSPLRRTSFGTGSNIDGSALGIPGISGINGINGINGFSYDDTQDVEDIEIEFPDDNEDEFDENDAGDPINVGTPGSVEAARGGMNHNNNNNNNEVAELANNVSDMQLSGLSAIKGPRPQLDGMSDMSDVASAVGSVNNINNINNLDNLSQASNDDIDNNNDIVMLDESVGMMPVGIGDMSMPQINENAADNASVVSTASVSTADLEAHKARKRAEARKNRMNRNGNNNNSNNTESGDDTDGEQEEGSNERNNNNRNKGNSEVPAKRYKKAKKMRFPVEVDDNGRVENDQNINGNGVDLDSYIQPERDILHIWRQRGLYENEGIDNMMNYPVCVADRLFGSNFAANNGNIFNQFDAFMPPEVTNCYRDIINQKIVENAENADDGEPILSQNNLVEDLLGPMFVPDSSPRHDSRSIGGDMDQDDDEAEFGRDGGFNNNNNNIDGLNESDDRFGEFGRNPLVGDDNNSLGTGSDIGKNSYLKPRRLANNFKDNASDTGSDNGLDRTTVIDVDTTMMDLIVNDNVKDLNNTVIDEHTGLISILQTPENENETRLHSIDEDIEDFDVHDIDIVEDNNNNNNGNNRNSVRKDGKNNKKSKDQSEDESSEGKEEVVNENGEKEDGGNENSQNVKFRSWSKRTQKTLQYLNNKEGNVLSFNEMMKETKKKETVAGVFYELLVLKNADLIEVEQDKCYDDLIVSKTDEFDEYVGNVKVVRMSQSQW